MNSKQVIIEDDRLHEIARKAGQEHSLYLGEAIGNMLVIAWNAIGTVGSLTRRQVEKPQ